MDPLAAPQLLDATGALEGTGKVLGTSFVFTITAVGTCLQDVLHVEQIVQREKRSYVVPLLLTGGGLAAFSVGALLNPSLPDGNSSAAEKQDYDNRSAQAETIAIVGIGIAVVGTISLIAVGTSDGRFAIATEETRRPSQSRVCPMGVAPIPRRLAVRAPWGEWFEAPVDDTGAARFDFSTTKHVAGLLTQDLRALAGEPWRIATSSHAVSPEVLVSWEPDRVSSVRILSFLARATGRSIDEIPASSAANSSRDVPRQSPATANGPTCTRNFYVSGSNGCEIFYCSGGKVIRPNILCPGSCSMADDGAVICDNGEARVAFSHSEEEFDQDEATAMIRMGARQCATTRDHLNVSVVVTLVPNRPPEVEIEMQGGAIVVDDATRLFTLCVQKNVVQALKALAKPATKTQLRVALER